MSPPRNQMIVKDSGLGSGLGTQSTTVKVGVYSEPIFGKGMRRSNFQ